MAMKRQSPDEAQIEKMSDYMHKNYAKQIIDRETFDKAYENYFQGQDWLMKQEIKSRTFKTYAKKNPKVYDGSYHEEAGGKDYSKDQKKKAKRIVTTPEEYRKVGADKSDLAGYDEPMRRTIPGRQKGKVVYSRAIQTKAGVRYIDAKGRYVSVKRR